MLIFFNRQLFKQDSFLKNVFSFGSFKQDSFSTNLKKNNSDIKKMLKDHQKQIEIKEKSPNLVKSPKFKAKSPNVILKSSSLTSTKEQNIEISKSSNPNKDIFNKENSSNLSKSSDQKYEFDYFSNIIISFQGDLRAIMQRSQSILNLKIFSHI